MKQSRSCITFRLRTKQTNAAVIECRPIYETGYLGAMLEAATDDVAGKMDLLGHRAYLVHVDSEATGTAAVPAEEGPPGHATSTEGTMDPALREEIPLFEPLSHFRAPLLEYVLTYNQRSKWSFIYSPFVICIVRSYNSLKHFFASDTWI